MPVRSAIRNATAPITGGMIWPPVEAAASTAPANLGGKPVRLIIGMVKTPVVTTLATAAPFIVPKLALPMIAACAGPPRSLPVTAKANLRSVAPAPEVSRMAPKRMNTSTTWPTTATGRPNTPSVLYHSFSEIRNHSTSGMFNVPGTRFPKSRMTSDSRQTRNSGTPKCRKVR